MVSPFLAGALKGLEKGFAQRELQKQKDVKNLISLKTIQQTAARNKLLNELTGQKIKEKKDKLALAAKKTKKINAYFAGQEKSLVDDKRSAYVGNLLRNRDVGKYGELETEYPTGPDARYASDISNIQRKRARLNLEKNFALRDGDKYFEMKLKQELEGNKNWNKGLSVPVSQILLGQGFGPKNPPEPKDTQNAIATSRSDKVTDSYNKSMATRRGLMAEKVSEIMSVDKRISYPQAVKIAGKYIKHDWNKDTQTWRVKDITQPQAKQNKNEFAYINNVINSKFPFTTAKNQKRRIQLTAEKFIKDSYTLFKPPEQEGDQTSQDISSIINWKTRGPMAWVRRFMGGGLSFMVPKKFSEQAIKAQALITYNNKEIIQKFLKVGKFGAAEEKRLMDALPSSGLWVSSPVEAKAKLEVMSNYVKGKIRFETKIAIEAPTKKSRDKAKEKITAYQAILGRVGNPNQINDKILGNYSKQYKKFKQEAFSGKPYLNVPTDAEGKPISTPQAMMRAAMKPLEHEFKPTLIITSIETVKGKGVPKKTYRQVQKERRIKAEKEKKGK